MKTISLSKKDFNTIAITVDSIEKVLSFSSYRIDVSKDKITLGLTCVGFGYSLELGIEDSISISGNLFAGLTIGDLQASIETFVNSSSGGTGALSYKVYSVLISQAGTSDPTVVVLENTTSETPTLARAGAGEYTITFVQTLAANKTAAIIGQPPLISAKSTILRTDANTITANSLDGSGSFADGLLSSTFLEIRIYQ